MDKVILLPSAILGLLLIILYLVRCWRSGTEFNHAVMINIVFQSSGIVCGFFLIASIFIPEIKERMTGIDIYIFVSGLAVFAVSLQGYHRDAICPSASNAYSSSEKNSETSNESGRTSVG